jgi:hypothetical protein
MNVKIRLEDAYQKLDHDALGAKELFQSITESYPNNMWALNGLIKALVVLRRFSEIESLLVRRVSLKTAHESDNEFIGVVNSIFSGLKNESPSKVECYKRYRDEVFSWAKSLSVNTDLFVNTTCDPTCSELTSKVAVLVSGQFRGYEYSLESLKVFLGEVDCDIYISAWDCFGFRDITSDKRSYSHLNRTFDPIFCKLVKDLDVNLSDYFNTARLVHSELTKPFDKEVVLNVFPNSCINILNDVNFEKKFKYLEKKLTSFHGSQEIFASSINMLKMVYANFDVQQQAIQSQAKYTHTLRVRPDFIFNENVKIEDLINESEESKGTCFLDSWGGEGVISDQFFFGDYKTGCFYNGLWDFWQKMEAPIDDIGNLLKPHKRLNDYLAFGGVGYSLLPDIRKSLDDSSRINREKHIDLILSDIDFFNSHASEQYLSLFNKYKELNMSHAGVLNQVRMFFEKKQYQEMFEIYIDGNVFPDVTADMYRDAALSISDENFLLSYQLIKIANEIRPSGPYIKKIRMDFEKIALESDIRLEKI